ncbi:hypothetical protein FOL47_001523 [Perkinsus chesapeaki]|uniref:Uncharacterized protein n=1 Tax=Perkinsus chesapeaki TaxID=330153 RepID=A0A7J6MKG2_PERCH|nr:hypothetical protein FOL47_001523 [Perkinsus chesapeaki]
MEEAASLLPIRHKYAEFKDRYSVRSLNLKEDERKFSEFKRNLAFIEETNKKNLTYWLAVNEFTAMTKDEFMTVNTCSPPDSDPSGALEGAFKIQTGTLAQFSVQQVIDCGRAYRTEGCNGGWIFGVFDYVQNKGIVPDQLYPYTEVEGKCKAVITVVTKQCLKKDCIDERHSVVIRQSQLDVLFAQLQVGPISVDINVEPDEWQSYGGGILQGFKCDGNPNHTMLLVGYGTENGVRFLQYTAPPDDSSGPRQLAEYVR